MKSTSTSSDLLNAAITQEAVVVLSPVKFADNTIADFCCTLLSPRFAQLLGRKPSEGIGQLISQFIDQTQCQGLIERLTHVLMNQHRDRYQVPLRHAGTNLTEVYELILVPLQQSVLVTVTPIVAWQKQLEQISTLQILNNAFTACLSGVTVYEALLDSTGKPTDFLFVMINETGLAMSGMLREQVIGKTLRELYPPTDSFGLFATYQQVYLTGVSYQGEHFYPDYRVWRQLVVARISGGIMVTYNDITAQKQLQQEHELLIDQLITHTSNGALLLEPILEDQQLIDLRLIRCNKVYAELRGFTPEQLNGQLMTKVAPGLKSAPLFDHIRLVLMTREPYQGVETQNFKGELRKASFQITTLRSSLLVMYEDLTESYRNQQQIEKLGHSLQQATGNLHEFAYIASHDLQEPLRKIQQFSGLLDDEYGEQLKEGRHYLESIRRSAHRLSVLLKALLTYSRLTTHQQAFQAVPLANVMNEVLRQQEATIRSSGALINIGPLPTINGDQSQLEQLFQQLLMNSLMYVKPGEVAHVHIVSEPVSVNQLPTVLQSKALAERYCCIRVMDAGIGFDPKYVDRIFGIFQRLHGKNQYPGMGIGLAICQRVADNHGGLIVAHSQLGQGATFEVYLPTIQQ